MEEGRITTPTTPRRRVPPSILVGSVLFCIMGLRTFRIDQLPTFELLMADASNASSSFTSYLFTNNNSSSFFGDWLFEENEDVANPVLQASKGGGGRLSLEDLMSVSASSLAVCDDGTQFVGPTPAKSKASSNSKMIPPMIHQTFPTYCLPPSIYTATQRWRNMSDDYEYYFYTNETIQTLFHQDWPEFPHLSHTVRCISSYEGLVNLWKALVLWEFGGIVVDIQLSTKDPAVLKALMSHDEEAVVFGPGTHPSHHGAMAMAPKHPLSYYLVLQILNKLQHQKKMTEVVDWAAFSGSEPLGEAWWNFVGLDVGEFTRPLVGYPVGRNKGRYNRTATFVKADLSSKNTIQLYPPLPGTWNVSCLHILHSTTTFA